MTNLLNTEALTAQYSRTDVDAYRKTTLVSGVKPQSFLKSTGVPGLSAYMLLGAGLFFVLMIATFVTSVFEENLGYTILGVVLICLLISAPILTLRIYRQSQFMTWRSHMQLMKFADDNGFTYLDHIQDVRYQGIMQENIGFAKTALQRVMRIKDSPLREWGDFYYLHKNLNRNNRLIRYGYVALALEKAVPHMILDAVSNNSKLFGQDSSNLPVSLPRSQRLTTDDAFSQHFATYVPIGYEDDARALLTSDVRQVLATYASKYDIEFVDGHVLLYRARPFNVYTPELADELYQLVKMLEEVLTPVVAEYRGVPVPANSTSAITPTNARLKKKPRTLTVIANILGYAFAAYILYQLSINR